MIIWDSNQNTPIDNTNMFDFSEDGDASLNLGGNVIWSTQTRCNNVETVELEEYSNLIFLNKDGQVLWQIFDLPTDNILSSESLKVGRNIISNFGYMNFSFGSYTLEMQE